MTQRVHFIVESDEFPTLRCWTCEQWRPDEVCMALSEDQQKAAGYVIKSRDSEWCLALHGNYDEHQCHKKPGHDGREPGTEMDPLHECYCGVWW